MKRIIQRLKNLFHLFESFIAQMYYGFPGRKLKIIGITGTDGKTTTTHLIYHILKTAGKKASMISTVFAKIGNKELDTGLHTTTPGRFAIPSFLKNALNHGDEYFVLEITSHALDQNRDFGLHYTVGVVTNITHEHLDYHQNYHEYLNIKAQLLIRSATPIVNADDQSFGALKTILKRSHSNLVTYALLKKAIYNINFKSIFKFQLTEYNNYNFLAAFSVCRELGIRHETIIEALKTFQLPPGRMDIVYDNKFKVIVDFAHTPNAIEKLLQSIKSDHLNNKTGRIIHVFGSAGLRDATKRPLMGRASTSYADVIILTEEDYRTEQVEDICNDIANGINELDFTKLDPTKLNTVSKKSYVTIFERKKAIDKAIEIVGDNDLIVITGKGHEKSLCRGNVEHPWDEKKEVMESLKRLSYL